ncbi:arginine--tRNA ligase [Candidatus Bathyarchaeota archaeon]|nr:arginine--tRNA ligase [Candidatus Bathyarchaeota archaeon]
MKSFQVDIEETPGPEFGDLSSIICFKVSKTLGIPPIDLAKMVATNIKLDESSLVKSVEAAGSGYLNFFLNYKKVNGLTLHSVRTLKESYGFLKSESPDSILVEHSSINPVHAIHVGQARNSILGDALCRMLRARGHHVQAHFYVNDAGRQTAIVAYGYERLGRVKSNIKPDHYIGQIYSVTSCLVEVRNLKDRLRRLIDERKKDERLEVQKRLDEWTGIAFELSSRYPELVGRRSRVISDDHDPEGQINGLLKRYESKDQAARDLIREVSGLCIEGFKQTFSRLGISFDFWDWESDLIWSGRVSDILKQLSRTGYVSSEGGVLRLESGRAVKEFGLHRLLGVTKDYDLPSVSLTRSDGTTLYITRDIAYSILKFGLCNRVINVVGMEQLHEQLHVRVALFVLGMEAMAERQRHFSFGLVKFPGEKMSSRRGRIITLDEVCDEAVRRAYLEVDKRTPTLDELEKKSIAETIGIGAIKYALLSVEPAKEVEYSWDRVIDFETNSAPFINYGYTRANGILRRLGKIGGDVRYEMLTHPLETRLILTIAKFPNVFVEAAEKLRPDILTSYADLLTKQFHEYYEHVDITHLENVELRDARGSLVEALRTVLRNCMGVIGITLAERM